MDVLKEDKEVLEGFLICRNCSLEFPIISGIPVLWDDFEDYLSRRVQLGGKLLLETQTVKMKSYVKKTLSQIPKKNYSDDRSSLEQRWVKIYQSSSKSEFYKKIQHFLKKISDRELVLEHGCSIGITSEFLAKNNQTVFGIDRSFYAIQTAKRKQKKNCDYFVADSELHPFGKQDFDLVVCLNMLELLEPRDFLRIMSKQVKNGTILISDPYDYDRGIDSVRKPIDSIELRKIITDLGFSILKSTKKPSFIPWSLNLNPRAKLNYKVDLVIANRK